MVVEVECYYNELTSATSLLLSLINTRGWLLYLVLISCVSITEGETFERVFAKASAVDGLRWRIISQTKTYSQGY